MGLVNSHLTPPRRLLRDYYRWQRRTGVHDETRLKVAPLWTTPLPSHVQELFALYDGGGKGYLSEDEALKYVADALSVAGEGEVRREAKTLPPGDRKRFVHDYVAALVHVMDPDVIGRVPFERLVRPCEAEWAQCVSDVGLLGSAQRRLTRTLRTQRLGDGAAAAELSSSQTDVDAVDAVWDAELEHTLQEARADQSLLRSSAKTPSAPLHWPSTSSCVRRTCAAPYRGRGAHERGAEHRRVHGALSARPHALGTPWCVRVRSRDTPRMRTPYSTSTLTIVAPWPNVAASPSSRDLSAPLPRPTERA